MADLVAKAHVPPGRQGQETITLVLKAPEDEHPWVPNDVAGLAAAGGLIIAVASALIAWRAYRNTKRENKLAHVNALFREMLALEFQYQIGKPASEADQKATYRRVMSHKMWVLEELWTWLQDYRKSRPWRPAARKLHLEAEGNWEATIAQHIRAREPWHFENFDKSHLCYRSDFTAFVTRIRNEKKSGNQGEKPASGSAGKAGTEGGSDRGF